MQINIPREFKLDAVPATMTLSDEDLDALLGDFPAELTSTDRTATFRFESPRAAADFVDSLDGQIPYSAREMTEEDGEVFETPGLGSVARDIVGKSSSHLGGADKTARAWGIAAFSVAVSGTVIALTALAIGIISLVM